MALGRTIFNMLVYIGVFYANAEILVPQLIKMGKYKRYLLAATILWLNVSIFRGFIGHEYFTNDRIDYPLFTDLGNFIILSHFTTFLVIMFSTFYRLAQDQFDDLKKTEEQRKVKQEAQLQYLMAQINPHFLFNTLNNIYALAYSQSEKTPDMILKLSQLLKYVLYECNSGKIALENEMENLRTLIDLYQMRFETPANITLHREGAQFDTLIEPMLLIPLVENALKHNDLDTNSEGFIRINTKIGRRRVHFITENTFAYDHGEKDEVGGVGLENMKQRLDLNYPNNYEFTTSEENGIFKAQLHLPLS